MPTPYDALLASCRTPPPTAAIVLGSGVRSVAEHVRAACSVPFGDIPGLSATTVLGHRGRLTLGDWAGKRVLVFEGRLHYYEGHDWATVVQPMRIAHQLGARVLLATNAAGGIHETLGPGCLMAIRDHVEWTAPQCWLRAGPGALGPPRASPYAPRLLQVLTQAARHVGVDLHQGIYAAVTGPCYETPAEIRALRTWGADAVGMSTAREVQLAYELGMEAAALSCITNRAAGLSGTRLDHEEVLAGAAMLAQRVAAIIEAVLQLL
jgi:purine-nucleoside phosphorylase